MFPLNDQIFLKPNIFLHSPINFSLPLVKHSVIDNLIPASSLVFSFFLLKNTMFLIERLTNSIIIVFLLLFEGTLQIKLGIFLGKHFGY